MILCVPYGTDLSGSLGKLKEMMIPRSLEPTTTEAFPLPSAALVQIPKTTPTFHKWNRPISFDRYGNKAVLNFQGSPLFAELVILRIFQEAGWTGVWVDTYRCRFRSSIEECIEIPKERLRLLENIYTTAGARGGCFDVFAWKEEEVVFAEAKRAGRDRIRRSQSRWLDAALRCGIKIPSFLVVEWGQEEPNERPAHSSR